jgi:hypothetical protein
MVGAECRMCPQQPLWAEAEWLMQQDIDTPDHPSRAGHKYVGERRSCAKPEEAHVRSWETGVRNRTPFIDSVISPNGSHGRSCSSARTRAMNRFPTANSIGYA